MYFTPCEALENSVTKQAYSIWHFGRPGSRSESHPAGFGPPASYSLTPERVGGLLSSRPRHGSSQDFQQLLRLFTAELNPLLDIVQFTEFQLGVQGPRDYCRAEIATLEEDIRHLAHSVYELRGT